MKGAGIVVLGALMGGALVGVPASNARAGEAGTAAVPEPPKSNAPIMIGGPFPVEVVHDLPYVDGPDADPNKQKLDLFLPKGQTNVPVLFFIHGGAWRTGDRKLYAPLGRTFARNGVATVVISYRLSPKVQHPGHIEDVARAFAWTMHNIAKYGGNPAEVFVTGQSAGGHLAALLATNEQYLAAEKLTARAIKGVIPISGIYVLREHPLLKGVLATGKEAVTSASPLQHVTGDEPPFLIIFADNDFTTCDTMSRSFADALRAKKVPARVVEIPNRNHLSIIIRMAASEADAVSQETLKFIAQHARLVLTPRRESAKNDGAANEAVHSSIKQD